MTRPTTSHTYASPSARQKTSLPHSAYYRALFDAARQAPELANQQAAVGGISAQPTLYLHGDHDGCIDVTMATATRQVLSPGSRVVITESAGQFLHLEKPDEVGQQIVQFLAA
jgi:pimeloyl-ACP methyl ester carboxylesterase